MLWPADPQASAAALAQEAPDLVGEWAVSGSGFPASDRCGESTLTAKAMVNRKVTARAYRGQFSSQQITERCGVINAFRSDFTLRIRDNKVTIAYDDEGLESDVLALDGGVMTGRNGKGISTEWVKQGEAEVAARTLTAAEEQQMDEFLGVLQPEFLAELHRLLGRDISGAIEKSGLNRDDSDLMVDLTLERMSACVVETIKTDIRAQAMPLQKVLASGNALVTTNPRKVDYGNMQCIQDAALNTGIVIR